MNKAKISKTPKTASQLLSEFRIKHAKQLTDEYKASKLLHTVISIKTPKVKMAKVYKAKALRFKNNTHIVGNTVFVFDSQGYMEIEDTGYVHQDFLNLLRLNGVTEIVPPPAVPTSVPADEVSNFIQQDLKAIPKEPIVTLPPKKKEVKLEVVNPVKPVENKPEIKQDKKV